nr:6638_t:CDS:2 [Entrophospora candida]
MSEQTIPTEKKSENCLSLDTEEQNKRRFQIELEFVQCLANPWYLHDLAQKDYFQDRAFLNYLKYLRYWKQPEYAKYIIYPHALHFLDLLQNPQFRQDLKKQDIATEIHSKQYYHWMAWRNIDVNVVRSIVKLVKFYHPAPPAPTEKSPISILDGVNSILVPPTSKFTPGQNNCSGGIQVRQSSDLNLLKNCKVFTGTIAISNVDDISDLIFNRLERLEGTLDINDNRLLRRVSFPNLTSVTRIGIANQTTLTKIEFPFLKQADTLTFRQLAADVTFDSGLEFINNIEISDTNIHELNGFNPKNVITISINNNPFLRELKLDSLLKVDSLYVASNRNDGFSFEAQNLQTVKDLVIENVTSLSLPSLVSSDSDIALSDNNFSKLSIPKLDSISGTFAIKSNPELKKLDFPELKNMGGALIISENPKLLTIDGFPKLKRINGVMDITGSFSEFSMPELKEIRGGVNVETSDKRFDCDNNKINSLKDYGIAKALVMTLLMDIYYC